MSIQNEMLDSENKRLIVVLFYGNPVNNISEVLNNLRNFYHVYLFDLSLETATNNNIYKPDSLRSNVDKINNYYEDNLLDSFDDVVFIINNSVAVSFLTWLHDFAPKIGAAILFTSEPGSLKSLSRETKRIAYDSAAISCPIMMISSKENKADRFFYNLISNENIADITILNNTKKLTIDDENKVKAFIEFSHKTSIDGNSLINADKKGFTYEERIRLGSPDKFFLKKLYWQAHRLLLRITGFFSKGIGIGINHGFDSGLMLDYVYRNIPQGRGFIGYIIDKLYLNSIPWKGVRYREKYVNYYLLQAIENLTRNDRRINIVDIAAGHAKYLFDLSSFVFKDINNVILRDYDECNCVLGNDIISNRDLKSKVFYEKGDAFSLDDLDTLPGDRTIAIASGFYELFDNNEMVIKSLKGIYNTLEEGGFFIYTNILWHPRHTYMARVLIRNNDKGAWLIRRRFQQELDALVRLAGFTKVSQKVDPWGIFSVSVARKCNSQD